MLQYDSWRLVVLNVVISDGPVLHAQLEFTGGLIVFTLSGCVGKETRLLSVSWDAVRQSRFALGERCRTECKNECGSHFYWKLL